MRLKPVYLLLGLWLGAVMPLAAPAATASDAVPAARSSRHALIITVSRYADAQLPELPGAKIDKQSATQIAQALEVPTENISYLEDEQATGDGIRQALRQLTERVQEGDRVYIHFSGHGTRNPDAQAGGCVEALLAYDGAAQGTLTNHEMAENLNAITRKTDKLLVLIDACHSGGVVQAATAVRTRGLLETGEPEGLLRARSAAISLECARPVNIKTRSFETETAAQGVLSQDIVHVSASRHNEISFDDERKGGLATQYMRDCMLREARDLDGSGAISMEEIRQCAQGKIDKRLAKDPTFKAHHLVLNGNAGFVPAWFSKDAVGGSVAEQRTLTGEQALRQMFDQRDAKRQVNVKVKQEQLAIGRDALDFSVQSDRPGYVYVALAGSDNQSLYMLFPNDLDQDNQLAAGQLLQLPRANWRVKASGPAGQDSLLVLVADAPRNLRALQKNKAGPFVLSLNDANGRAQLGALMTASEFGASPVCSGSRQARPKSLCSDAYGASMVTIQEVK